MLRLQRGVSSSCQLHRWIRESISLLQRRRHGRPPSHYHWQMNTVYIRTGTWPWHISAVSICDCFQVVKVWDFDSGRQVFEFGGAPDSSVITCMTFDHKGRRYSRWSGIITCIVTQLHLTTACFCVCRLITGGNDGCLKIWNFNNGQCLKTLKRGKYYIYAFHRTSPVVFMDRKYFLWHLQLCLWWQNQELKAKTFNPNRVLFVPQQEHGIVST